MPNAWLATWNALPHAKHRTEIVMWSAWPIPDEATLTALISTSSIVFVDCFSILRAIIGRNRHINCERLSSLINFSKSQKHGGVKYKRCSKTISTYVYIVLVTFYRFSRPSLHQRRVVWMVQCRTCLTTRCPSTSQLSWIASEVLNPREEVWLWYFLSLPPRGHESFHKDVGHFPIYSGTFSARKGHEETKAREFFVRHQRLPGFLLLPRSFPSGVGFGLSGAAPAQLRRS